MLATGFGIGFLPLAPGTWGSLAATAGVAALAVLGGANSFFILLALSLFWLPVALISASLLSRSEGDPDPSWVVSDEIAGQFICFLLVPISPLSLVLGFILFRVFDIWKPFPARRCEKLPGGWGILLDDLVAGLYSGLLLKLFLNYAG